MTPKDYIKNVLVTESKNFEAISERLSSKRNIRLIHASAGLTSEVAEILKAVEMSRDLNDIDRVNIMEEMGDLLWYIGIAADELGETERIMGPVIHVAKKLESDNDLAESIYTIAGMMAADSGEFADLAIKKFCFYGKPFDAEPLVQILIHFHGLISIALAETGYTVEDARERNIAKLKARYGDKFTEAAALERNLSTERDILEKK